jgi:hypothetical protein
MKSVVVVLIGTLVITSTVAQTQFGGIAGEAQIFAPSTDSTIRASTGAYRSLLRSLIWPSVSEGALQEWQLNAIPASVISAGTEWTRRIVKAELLPANLNQRWRGLEQFGRADCLCFRYFDGTRKVQVVENGSSVIVVISPTSNEPRPLARTAAELLINTTGNGLLNLPTTPAPRFVLQSSPIGASGATLWYGYVDRAPQQDAREWSWWTHMTVATDGATVAFIVPENMPSTGSTFGGATSGSGRRFRDGD